MTIKNPKQDKSEYNKTEKKIVFSARIPETLYAELKNYIEKYGAQKESINDIIVAGAMTELKERLKKNNAKISNKSKKENIIKTIENNIDELKTLL